MTAEILRRAPLGEWAGRLPDRPAVISAGERPFLTQLTLRVRAGHEAAGAVLGVPLPSAPCTFTAGTGEFGAVDVLWLGPDEYLVLAAPGVAGLEPAVREAITVGAVTDVSAQRTTVDLSGPAVRDVLAHGCSIDLHPKAAPAGTCVQTLIARTGVVLLVRGNEEYTVLVRQSFAAYFATWLVDAALEYRAGP